MPAKRRTTIGWREWVQLPELGLPAIKAKIDTGARTSTLHAFQVEEFDRDGQRMVRFSIHPLHNSNELEQVCEAQVVDVRPVTDSGGRTEERYVIQTDLLLADETWPIEITLTSRDNMRFRMLLGRTAMRKRLIVDPDASFLCGDISSNDSDDESTEED